MNVYVDHPLSLVELCLWYIENNLDNIPLDLELLPSDIVHKILEFMLLQRKIGSRRLTDTNISQIKVELR
jgi:hypothetical protein